MFDIIVFSHFRCRNSTWNQLGKTIFVPDGQRLQAIDFLFFFSPSRLKIQIGQTKFYNKRTSKRYCRPRSRSPRVTSRGTHEGKKKPYRRRQGTRTNLSVQRYYKYTFTIVTTHKVRGNFRKYFGPRNEQHVIFSYHVSLRITCCCCCFCCFFFHLAYFNPRRRAVSFA